ncbi:MAG: hypothetical protein LBC53_00135 [Spirochaetaceae bacterium]|jgi:hypothetical protein|nr:hypothetical protein [Spirochaetaceae bacterium]
MKKWLVLFFVAITFLGCKTRRQNNIIGTWTTLHSYYGIVERMFNDDNTVISKTYNTHDSNFYERTDNYDIIDNILFIKNETYNADETYNFCIIDNKLLLMGYEKEIYTRKLKDTDMSKLRSYFTGQWTGSKNNMHYDLIFLSNDMVNIKEYDENENIIYEKQYAYRITEQYFILDGFDNENNFSKKFMRALYTGNYIYKINSRTLVLKGYNSEDGERSSMYLIKK